MAKVYLVEGKTTRSIIGAFYEVYNILGFGFREHIYILALERELIARGHHVAREVCVIVSYKGEELTRQRIDMIVDGKVVVETKSTYTLPKGCKRQVLSYLRATTLEVGLLLHFGPEANFYRMVCRHPPNPVNPRDPRSFFVVDLSKKGSLRDDASPNAAHPAD